MRYFSKSKNNLEKQNEKTGLSDSEYSLINIPL